MLTLHVYTADGEFVLTSIMEDMASFLHVMHTEFEPRWAANPDTAKIAGTMFVIDDVRGPDTMLPQLPQRQKEILELLAQSLTPKQIASRLDVSESTVRMHINRLKKRFNVSSIYNLMSVTTAVGLCSPFSNDEHKSKITVITKEEESKNLLKPPLWMPPL